MTSPRILDAFVNGFHTLARVYYLAFLPLLVDFVFLTGRFIQSYYTYSYRIGVKIVLPFYFPSLTDVYDFPARPGLSFQLTGYDILPIFGIGIILYTVVQAYLSAGYLGRLHSSITSTTTPPSFFALAARYFVRILGYGLLWLALSLFSLVLLFASSVLFIVYFAFLFVFGYFLFLTPFIVVADDATLSQAFEASIRTASSSRTLEYAILYGLVTVLISIFVYVILNIGFPGFILAIVGFAFVGTGLVASTFHFITRPSTPTAPIDKVNIV